jgi:dephospho-CoA kinase
MKVIGLTGGIGTGKSTVSAYLKEKGCFIIDADNISRQMTEKGSPALVEIRDNFGDKYFLTDGSLNRQALGNLVFKDKDKLQQLQDIITRKVVEQTKIELGLLKDKNFTDIVVIDAPLLFECGMEELSDENWLVIADLEIRIKRVEDRDNLTRQQILERINNQMPDEEKAKLSQCIIDNSKSIGELHKQLDFQLERIKNEK